jgi:hypothetical protein
VVGFTGFLSGATLPAFHSLNFLELVFDQTTLIEGQQIVLFAQAQWNRVVVQVAAFTSSFREAWNRRLCLLLLSVFCIRNLDRAQVRQPPEGKPDSFGKSGDLFEA